VLGNAFLLEMRMYASGGRRGSRSDAKCLFDLGCTWRITVVCHLSAAAKGFCDIVDVCVDLDEYGSTFR
jgi:hypothetical protein